MFKKLNKKGFTLAELLVVVAIIGVLVAISIPIFTSQLEKAREATDAANLRSAYAELMADAITDEKSAKTATVKQEQTAAGWTTTPDFPSNFKVDAPTTANSTWSLSLTKDDKGLVTGVEAKKA